MTAPTSNHDLSDIDLTDASVWEQAAPHDALDRLRTHAPVHWHEESDGKGFWALTRHEDIREVSTAPLDYSSYLGGPTRLDPLDGGLDQVRMIIIGMDPPEHRTFRNIVAKAFTPKMLSGLEASLRAETARVVGEMRERRECEFVTDVAGSDLLITDEAADMETIEELRAAGLAVDLVAPME